MDIKFTEKGGKKYKKDSDGNTYRISWSEELQMKLLSAQKKNAQLLKLNFYAKVGLGVILILWFAVFLFLLYRLDAINFFTSLIYP